MKINLAGNKVSDLIAALQQVDADADVDVISIEQLDECGRREITFATEDNYETLLRTIGDKTDLNTDDPVELGWQVKKLYQLAKDAAKEYEVIFS